MADNTSLSNALQQDHKAIRCVVDNNGSLIYATPAFGWQTGQEIEHIISKPVTDILRIVTSQENNDIPTDNIHLLKSGFYEIALYRQDRDPILLNGRIDTVKSPSGGNFTVFWLNPEDSLTKDIKNHPHYNDIATHIAQTASQTEFFKNDDFAQKSLPEKNSFQDNNDNKDDYISKADSELKHFLNLSNDLLGIYDRNGAFIRVNYAYNRVTGYSDNDLRYIPFIDLIYPEDRIWVAKKMRQVIEAVHSIETRIDFEARTLCKDKSVRVIQWIQKSIGEYIYIVGQDVTDIRKHEEELQWREQQLSEAQKIGQMGHWNWTAGQDKITWSQQIYKIFGLEKKSYAPSLGNIDQCIVKDDIAHTYLMFQRALNNKRNYSTEFRIRMPDGEIRYMRCEGRCQLNSRTGNVSALFGIIQDITERTLYELELRNAKEAAETAYASKTRFLANMSHELRTPLNAIIGFSEMMQRQLLGPVGNDRYLDYIGGIRESGEHLLDLINDILDMSKIEVGKYELEVEQINVGKVICLAIHMMEGRAHEAQISISADKLADDIQIYADRRAVMQILLNILSNAVKFTEPTGKISIECKTNTEDNQISIAITDTGIGIPADKIDTITRAFEQVDCELTRKHEGSGLGLAITKSLIELHHGTLSIDSTLKIGTTVTVILPINCQDMND